jgi:hypothetical protein
MTEHVQKVIEETERKIGELKGLVAQLITVFGNGQVLPGRGIGLPDWAMVMERTAKTVETVGGGPRRTHTPLKQGVNEKGKSDKSRTMPEMIRAILPKFKGEFKSKEMEQALLAKFPEQAAKIKTGIYYGLSALVKKEVLKSRRVAGGHDWLYTAVAKADAPPTHQVLPGPGARVAGRTKAIVERELEAAMKDRDAQRAEGRTTMEAIAQKKVDRLEEELEAFDK